MRATRFPAVVWCVLAAFYVLFVGQPGGTEVIAGAIATLPAAGFAVALHRAGTRRLSLRAPWPRLIARPLAAVFPDAMRVGAVLLGTLRRRPRGTRGVIICQPFRDDEDAAGRRALVTLALSLAPNGYVLDRAGGRDALLLHRLAPAAAETDREWPA